MPAKNRSQAREQPFKATELLCASICANKQLLLSFTFFDLRVSSVSEKFSVSDQRYDSEKYLCSEIGKSI